MTDHSHPVERPGRVKIVFLAVRRGTRRAWGVASWISSIFLFALGYWGFPILKTSVTWPWDTPPEVWGPAFLVALLTFGWILIEIKFTVSNKTTVEELQFDAVASPLVAMVLCVILGAMIKGDGVPWWFLIPYVGAVIDGLQAGYLGVNNSFQKVSPGEMLKTATGQQQ